MKIQTQASCRSFKGEGFIKHYQELVENTVIPYQYEILNDKIPDIEKSHALQNFINAGKTLKGDMNHDGFYGMVFQDSDVAKWLEAASYSLANHPDKGLECQVDEVIDIVAAAQDEDGYLDTYFTIKDKDKRFSNLLEGHELYCAGHMIEAAVANFEATGKTKLLGVARKCADNIYRYFIMEKHAGCPGHPEVELALMKLSRATGEKKYSSLAKHFIDERGKNPTFFADEAEGRDWTVWGNDGKDATYMQAQAPVREHKDAVGHAVRAAYLYTAMADIAGEMGDEELYESCKRLWDSITKRRMYVTGAIGSTNQGEAFTVDYDLPNDTAYGETCASIGLMFFASRMLEREIDGRYADVMEKAFYNTVLAGMQLDGRRFFYVNPLEVVPGVSGVAPTHRHTLPKRPQWYACACCPPNAARTIESIAKYAFGENKDTAYCHMLLAGSMEFDNGLKIKCTTGYPYELAVTIEIAEGKGELAVHIPGWSLENYTCSKEGRFEKGYLYMQVEAGEKIELTFDDEIKKLYCTTACHNNSESVAISRGPLIYCAEGADNGEEVLDLIIKENGKMQALPYDEKLLCGVVALEVEGYRREKTTELYTTKKPAKTPLTIKMIPYYTWGNRSEGAMRVWLPESN